jgi:hypothetical protein
LADVMDPTKVDPILRYAMAVAAREDDPWDRRLGAIHLLKFVYLADLAYSERHAGHTFTGAQWRFYHYGPWAAPVFDRIKPVIEGLDVEEHRFAGMEYENDSVRWSLSEDEDPDEIIARDERDLPIEIAGRVKWAVHQFGHDTAALLHYVYTTPPMTRAAPNETLRFEAVEPAAKREVVPTEERSVRAQKKLRQAVEALRNHVQERLRAALSRRDQESAGLPPRYDDVFVQGQKWLDEKANVDSLEGEVEFPPDIWRSPWRGDPGASS